jgi:hypothetical protein
MIESSLARWSGWIAVALVVAAALMPIWQRLRFARRASPDSPPMRAHVTLGIATALFGFGHTLTALTALGSERATAAGNLALVPGCLAFLVIVAHVGVGLQLRDPKLRDRASKRRTHLTTAILIALAVGVHVGALLASGGP